MIRTSFVRTSIRRPSPRRTSSARHIACTALALSTLIAIPAVAAKWTQFGGPGRDFIVEEAPRIADWGETGPRSIWQRELGPGYSGLVADPTTGRLFTLARDGEDELVVALDPASGKTVWQARYRAPVDGLRGVDMSYGNAPQATPVLHDGRVFTFGFTGMFHALDAATGDILWGKDLGAEFEARIPYFGHASSPLIVEEPEGASVVVIAGGALAFEPASGALRWQNRSFDGSYASPILADTRHGRQIIAAVAGEVVGLEPSSGELLWRHAFTNPQRTILATPILVQDDLLFVSVYFVGSRGLRLAARDRVEVLWEQPDFQVSHFNALRQGTSIYTTYKKNLLAIDALTGEILSEEKRFGAANLMQAGPHTLLLGERGELVTARLDPSGAQKQQSARILDSRSWTPPTLLGDRLYVRDQAVVVAHDLSAANPVTTPAADAAEGRTTLPVPEAFREVIASLQMASVRGDAEAVEAAMARFAQWDEDPQLGTWAAYHRGFGYWQMSFTGSAADQLAMVDRAVEAGKRSIELDRRNVEAHALLGTLYPRYYQLSPQRAMVVGYLGNEHLGQALDLEPDNPRARALHGVRLAYTPAQWGGDPAEARTALAAAITLADRSRERGAKPANGAGPVWGPALARVWLARLLATQEPKDVARARRLLDEALALAPDYALARSLRAQLDRDGEASAQHDDQGRDDQGRDDQERGSSRASRR